MILLVLLMKEIKLKKKKVKKVVYKNQIQIQNSDLGKNCDYKFLKMYTNNYNLIKKIYINLLYVSICNNITLFNK